MKYSQLQIWIMAIRPKTLMAAIAPVFIGSAMAYGDGVHHIPAACAAMAAALAIQIGTNFANDYFDYKKGADCESRIGPQRVTQSGLVSPDAMKIATVIAFVVAWFACLWLIKRGGWPIAVIGVLSILSGIFYTAGPRPLGYLGLGEVFVFIFFGPVAVAGTYYVQSLEMNAAVILAGIAPGLISSGILVVNNLRDISTDRASNKKTLAVRFGHDFAKSEYLILILLAALMPILIYQITEDHMPTLWASLICLAAVPVISTVYSKSDGPSLNKALADTGKLLMAYSIVFSVGWVL